MLSQENTTKLVNKFNDMGGNPVKVETLLADAEIEVWATSRTKIREALEFHGLTIKNGEVRKIDTAEFRSTVKTGFDEFMIAAAGVSRLITEPVSLDTIISMSGIGASAIPGVGINHYLKKAGLYHIQGVGYWTEPQYANDTGQIWTLATRRGKASVIIEALHKYGWPLCGRELEQATRGEVTSQYLAKMSMHKTSGIVTSLGNGLYVPRGAVTKHPFPISMRVAQFIVKHTARQIVITNEENPLLYKLGYALAKIGYVVLNQKSAFRNGRRQRAIQIELTPHGHKMLVGSGKTIKDDF